MKRSFITVVFAVAATLFQMVYANDWIKFSSNAKRWDSTSPEWPIVLRVAPGDENSCEVAGGYFGNYIISLKGEAWPKDGEIMLKVKGAANGVEVMLYGTVKYYNAETILYEGDASIGRAGAGVEYPMSFMLFDYEAKESRELAEREAEQRRLAEAEAKRKASPEYRLHEAFSKLVTLNRVGLKKKKSYNWGQGVMNLLSGNVVAVATSVDSNTVFDVFTYGGETKSGKLSQNNFEVTLKDKTVVNIEFAGSCDF